MSSLTKEQKKGAEKCLTELLKVLELERCMEVEVKDITKRFMAYCKEIVNDYEFVDSVGEVKSAAKKSILKSGTTKKKGVEEDGSIAAKKKIVLVVPKKSATKKTTKKKSV